MQSQGRASLTPAPSQEAGLEEVSTTFERRSRCSKVIAGLALSLLALDQASKFWAVTSLESRGSINILGSFLKLNHTTNSGAAFNMGSNFTIFLTVFAIIVSAGLIIFAGKIVEIRWAVGFGGLLGGVLGNLSDRIFREPRFLHGHVVDFIQIPNWPIFNVADIAITSSGVLIAYLLFKDIKPFATFADSNQSEQSNAGEMDEGFEEDDDGVRR